MTASTSTMTFWLHKGHRSSREARNGIEVPSSPSVGPGCKRKRPRPKKSTAVSGVDWLGFGLIFLLLLLVTVPARARLGDAAVRAPPSGAKVEPGFVGSFCACHCAAILRFQNMEISWIFFLKFYGNFMNIFGT